MTEEEIQALQTELEAVKADKVTLANELESFRSSFGAKENAITELEQAVANITAERDTLASTDAERQRAITDLTDSYTQAVAAYKSAVAQANPSVPGELIAGDTIETVNQSLESAQTLVSQVRQSLEADIASSKVPAGAPARTAPDLSSLSPREKIKYALGGK
jgi:chromosome segregation ATPase